MVKKGKKKGGQSNKEQLAPPPPETERDSFDLADQLLAALDGNKASDTPEPPTPASPPSPPKGRSTTEPTPQDPTRSQDPLTLPQATDDSRAEPTIGGGDARNKKKSRAKQRLEKRAEQEAAARAAAEKEVAEFRANNGQDPEERERIAIERQCQTLGRDMVEISPDGNCLFAAIADQLNLLAKVEPTKGRVPTLTYKDVRTAAATTMRSDPDSFKPFISDADEKLAGVGADAEGDPYEAYCDAVQHTAIWGGQPEILALSTAYKTPITVIQQDSSSRLAFGEGFEGPPVFIAYYRAAYGLGEHYNSLRPHQTQPDTAAAAAAAE